MGSEQDVSDNPGYMKDVADTHSYRDDQRRTHAFWMSAAGQGNEKVNLGGTGDVGLTGVKEGY